MKDLKHLIYFESLLADANNELVKQAAADGKKAPAGTRSGGRSRRDPGFRTERGSPPPPFSAAVCPYPHRPQGRILSVSAQCP